METNNSSNQVFYLFYNSPSLHFDVLMGLLSGREWRVRTLNSLDDINFDEINGNQLSCLAILNPINSYIPNNTIELLHRLCLKGKLMLMISSGDNGDQTNTTNLNDLVARFGVRFNQDCVIRPNLYLNYHPKEAQLEDFIANRGLSDSWKKQQEKTTKMRRESTIDQMTDKSNSSQDDSRSTTNYTSNLTTILQTGRRILYVRGCTLKVLDTKLSTIMMTSSKWTIPTEQAICTFHVNNSNGRAIVLGSAEMFSDQYINHEDNRALFETLIEFMRNSTNSPTINISDARTVETPDPNITADMNYLIELPFSCLQESEPLPENKLSLIDKRLFSIDNSLLPTISRAYQDLNIVHEPLTLIKPQLDYLLKPAAELNNFLIRDILEFDDKKSN